MCEYVSDCCVFQEERIDIILLLRIVQLSSLSIHISRSCSRKTKVCAGMNEYMKENGMTSSAAYLLCNSQLVLNTNLICSSDPITMIADRPASGSVDGVTHVGACACKDTHCQGLF